MSNDLKNGLNIPPLDSSVEIPVAIDVEAHRAKVERARADEKQAEERVPALFVTLRQMEATQADKDVFAEQIRKYRGVINNILADKSPGNITKRRVVVRELIIDKFAQVYRSFEEVRAMLKDLIKQGCLMSVPVPEGVRADKAEGAQISLWAKAFAVALDAHLNDEDVAKVQAAFKTLYQRVEEETFKTWQHQVEHMKYDANVSLQEVLEGKVGMLYTYIPSGRDSRGNYLQGGHALWTVLHPKSGEDRTEIELCRFCGDHERREGFNFMRMVEDKIFGLSPKARIPVSTLRFHMAFEKDPKTPIKFYQDHPAHVIARERMHAILKRAIEQEYKDGTFKMNLRWLAKVQKTQKTDNVAPVVTTQPVLAEVQPEQPVNTRHPQAVPVEEGGTIPSEVSNDPLGLGVAAAKPKKAPKGKKLVVQLEQPTSDGSASLAAAGS